MDSKSKKDLEHNQSNSRNESDSRNDSDSHNESDFKLNFDRSQYNLIREQFKQPPDRLLEDSQLFRSNEIHISEHVPMNTKLS